MKRVEAVVVGGGGGSEIGINDPDVAETRGTC